MSRSKACDCRPEHKQQSATQPPLPQPTWAEVPGVAPALAPAARNEGMHMESTKCSSMLLCICCRETLKLPSNLQWRGCATAGRHFLLPVKSLEGSSLITCVRPTTVKQTSQPPSPVALRAGAGACIMARHVALVAPCTLAAAVQRRGVLPATCAAGAGTAACVMPGLQAATHSRAQCWDPSTHQGANLNPATQAQCTHVSNTHWQAAQL